MDNWGLLQPYYLLLIPLPFLWKKYRAKHAFESPNLVPTLSLRFPLVSFYDNKQTDSYTQKKNSFDWWVTWSFVFLILSLSQPVQYTTLIQPNNTKPIDMVLLIGSNISMSLKDHSINGQPTDRLSYSKKLLRQLILSYSGERMGVSIMGNPPLFWLPYTHDKQIVLDAVDRTRVLLGGRVTNIASSLDLVSKNYHSNNKQIVLMISDGGLQLGNISPQEAAQQLAKKGFKLHVLAVGNTNKDFTSPQITSGLIYQKPNLSLLKEIAIAGNGELFEINKNADVQKILTLINMEAIDTHNPKEAIHLRKSRYPYTIGIAMICIWIAMFGGISIPRTISRLRKTSQ